jgi:hypothetical protein
MDIIISNITHDRSLTNPWAFRNISYFALNFCWSMYSTVHFCKENSEKLFSLSIYRIQIQFQTTSLWFSGRVGTGAEEEVGVGVFQAECFSTVKRT